jgi:hypothetical protein
VVALKKVAICPEGSAELVSTYSEDAIKIFGKTRYYVDDWYDTTSSLPHFSRPKRCPVNRFSSRQTKLWARPFLSENETVEQNPNIFFCAIVCLISLHESYYLPTGRTDED